MHTQTADAHPPPARAVLCKRSIDDRGAWLIATDARHLPTISVSRTGWTMSTSATILDYINALKWPVIGGAALIYFHDPIAKILRRISESKRGSISGPGGTGVSWNDELKEVGAAVEEAKAEVVGVNTAVAPSAPQPAPEPRPIPVPEPVLPSAPTPGTQPARQPGAANLPNITDWSTITALAASTPSGAVLFAYANVEKAIKAIARHAGLADTYTKDAMSLATSAQLPSSITPAIAKLSQLRNQVADGVTQPSTTAALEYVASAKELCDLVIQI